MKKITGIVAPIQFVIVILLLIGEVKCIVKAINCDWDPVGKAEVIYTVGAFTGAGSIIGWFDIEDGEPEVTNQLEGGI